MSDSAQPCLPPNKPVEFRPSQAVALVSRSVVPVGLAYGEYKRYLRVDFFHTCAYCTIAEAEARAIRFTIDHYEPQQARPDLANDYGNLMYACDTCNTMKGDRYPPENARKDGFRFFRPDQDLRRDHFERQGIEVVPKSNVGFFTIETLDLNRAALRRLRELRDRLKACDQYVVEGIMGLRSFPTDALPSDIRGKAITKIKEAMAVAEDIGAAIDSLLQEYAKSPLVDPDAESAERAKHRAASQKELEALYPGGRWRAPRKRRSHGKQK